MGVKVKRISFVETLIKQYSLSSLGKVTQIITLFNLSYETCLHVTLNLEALHSTKMKLVLTFIKYAIDTHFM